MVAAALARGRFAQSRTFPTPRRTNRASTCSFFLRECACPGKTSVTPSTWAKLIGNHDRAVFRSHLFPFRVPHHQPHQIRSRLHVKTRFHVDTGPLQPFPRSVEQT